MIVTTADCIKFGYAPRKRCDTCDNRGCHPNDIKLCSVKNCPNNFCIDCAVVFNGTVICPVKHTYVHCETKNENTTFEYCDCKNYLDFEYSPQELVNNLCSCGKHISF